MVTVREVCDAFHLLYTQIHNREFRKCLYLNEWKERDLLPLAEHFYWDILNPLFQNPTLECQEKVALELTF